MLQPGTTRKSLLIVDNSHLIVERLIGMLKETKAIGIVLTADNYDEAVMVLSEKKIDVVFLEINLSGKNGIELLEFIVKNHPGTKVIMLTNLVSKYYQRLCKNMGAMGFIDKSREFDLIPEMLAEIE